jgi:hypothetical protein
MRPNKRWSLSEREIPMCLRRPWVRRLLVLVVNDAGTLRSRLHLPVEQNGNGGFALR